MLGRGADEEFPEERLVDLVHPDDRGIIEELWKDALENTTKVAFELRRVLTIGFCGQWVNSCQRLLTKRYNTMIVPC